MHFAHLFVVSDAGLAELRKQQSDGEYMRHMLSFYLERV